MILCIQPKHFAHIGVSIIFRQTLHLIYCRPRPQSCSNTVAQDTHLEHQSPVQVLQAKNTEGETFWNVRTAYNHDPILRKCKPSTVSSSSLLPTANTSQIKFTSISLIWTEGKFHTKNIEEVLINAINQILLFSSKKLTEAVFIFFKYYKVNSKHYLCD